MDRDWSFPADPAAAGAATASSSKEQNAKKNSLERWLVNRVMKKGVAALSREELSVLHSSLPVFELEWRNANGGDLPETVRQQIEARMVKTERKFEEQDQVPLFQKAVLQNDVAKVRQSLIQSQANVTQLAKLIGASML